MHIAVVGATGVVGREIIKLLERKNFPIKTLTLFASSSSLGKTIPFRGNPLPVKELSASCFEGVDYAFFSGGNPLSKKYIPIATSSDAIAIDGSSAFRNDPRVPLIIPEVNGDDLSFKEKVIASPNCTTTLMLMVLAPLYKKFGIHRIVGSTYQAASGAGKKGIEQLREETKNVMDGTTPYEKNFPFPYAFNLFLHESEVDKEGFSLEEKKMTLETKKILRDPTIGVNMTCVRVPVFRTHTQSLNVEFQKTISPQAAYAILEKAPGIEKQEKGAFPMPANATGKEEVLYGRIRKDPTRKNALDFFIAGDQLLRGAALNMVCIAKLHMEMKK